MGYSSVRNSDFETASKRLESLQYILFITNVIMLLGRRLLSNLLAVCILAPYGLAAHGAIIVLREPLRDARLVKDVAALL